MGQPHPLDARGLPRHGRHGPGRFQERVGRALLALSPALAGPQGERDPAWDAVYQARAAEFRALRERLADPAQRERAILDYRAATERLAREARDLALPLVSKAYELGSTEEYAPELEERLAYLELAAAAAEFCGQQPAAAKAEQERALVLEALGRRREARDVLEAALARLVHAGFALPYLRQSLAELERGLGNPARALELAQEVLRACAGDESLAELAATAELIRDHAHLDLGLPDLAWDGIQQRWKRAEERWSTGRASAVELGQARLALLHLLRAVGDDRGVLEHVERFLADRSLPEEARQEARCLLLSGASLVGADVPAEETLAAGAQRLRRALELDLEGRERAFAQLELAEAALLGGRADEARDALAAAHALLDGAERESSPEAARLATLEARLALATGATAAELGALRARLERALEHLLEQWSRAPQREGGVGYLLYARRREIAGELARMLVALEGEEAGSRAAFAAVLALQAQGTLARREGAPPVDLDAIRSELLDEGRGVLVYLPASSRSHLFALDRARFVHAELAPSAGLETLRRDYLSHLVSGASALADPAQREWVRERERELAGALARELLPEQVRALLAAWTGVTIVGLDVLGPLPFEWLPLGDEPYLGVARAIDYLPSLPLGVSWARRGERRFERGYLLVGGAVPGPLVRERWSALAPLTLDPGLRSELAAPFAAHGTAVLEGASATRSALLAPDLQATRVLQLLVHGVQEHERERSLALVLSPADGADDGLLRWEDVARARAPGLVLMTGCRTGAGPTRKGDPAIGDLGGAWLAAGAGAVLASRTEMTLSEARRFSAAFAPRLVAGDSPAAALRSARAELAREQGPDAPFRQGILQLVGLGHRPLFPAAPDAPLPWRPLAAGALAGLALGLALSRFRRDRAAARSAGPARS